MDINNISSYCRQVSILAPGLVRIRPDRPDPLEGIYSRLNNYKVLPFADSCIFGSVPHNLSVPFFLEIDGKIREYELLPRELSRRFWGVHFPYDRRKKDESANEQGEITINEDWWPIGVSNKNGSMLYVDCSNTRALPLLTIYHDPDQVIRLSQKFPDCLKASLYHLQSNLSVVVAAPIDTHFINLPSLTELQEMIESNTYNKKWDSRGRIVDIVVKDEMLEYIELFINAGLAISCMNVALNLGKFNWMKSLFDKIDVNYIDENGGTLLNYAAGSGNLDRVKELIALGADWRIRDQSGNSAEDRARYANAYEVEQYLRSLTELCK
jgi:hypothetical protein